MNKLSAKYYNSYKEEEIILKFNQILERKAIPLITNEKRYGFIYIMANKILKEDPIFIVNITYNMIDIFKDDKYYIPFYGRIKYPEFIIETIQESLNEFVYLNKNTYKCKFSILLNVIKRMLIISEKKFID